MNKKKLLVLTSTFPKWKNDTIPSFVLEICKGLSKKFELIVLTPHYPGSKKIEKLDEMKVYRFKYFFDKWEKLANNTSILQNLKKNKLNYLLLPFLFGSLLINAYKIVKNQKINLIHAHWIFPQGLIALFIKKILNTPYLLTSHGSDILQIKRLSYLKKKILKNASHITVVSEEIKNKILTEIDNSLKIAVLPMGINTNLFQYKKNNVKKEYNINGPMILYVGRLSPEKNIHPIIQAMADKKLSNHKLLLIGSGILEDDLVEIVASKNLTKKIIFIGPLPKKDLPKFYSAADVLILNSPKEGFGLVCIESLSCLTPVLIKKISLYDNIGHLPGVNLIKNNELLAEDILNAINKDQKKELIKTRDFIIKNYAWDVVTKKYTTLLKQL